MATLEGPGITGSLMLDGWGLKGLLGYMWLHAGGFHLLGNMWFLWIFGNAVCAKVGNGRYLLLYILFGFAGGVAHLLMSDGSAIGASGAMNGVVGMYLVLFYENSITCYIFFWFLVYIRLHGFAVSSCWMILFWLFWDMVGAFSGDSGTAHFAHLGGFGAGFGVAILMCKHGWVTMERYEKSLLQMWEERKARKAKAGANLSGDRLGVSVAVAEAAAEMEPQAAPAVTENPKPLAILSLEDGLPRQANAGDALVGVACACGKKLKVPRRYAGKAVRCPRCKGRVVVPSDAKQRRVDRTKAKPVTTGRDNADSCIRFVCTCGKRIKVPGRYAGRSGRCPQCGCRLRIPQAS